jgi:hypothetical protein
LEAELRATEPDRIAARYDAKPKVARPSRPLSDVEKQVMRERISDNGRRLEFAGISDPEIFNPAWSGEFAAAAVQGSHYATMLSLLGRVWRKTHLR